MSGQDITIATGDGVTLAGRFYAAPAGVGSPVLIAGGLGIPQRFYAPFAQWLAARGHATMSFDPRGMGASRAPENRNSLRGLQADMLSWARVDFAAAVAHLAARGNDGRIALIGHSLGFHHAAMTDAATQARIRVAVSVAAGSGYWRDWATPSRRKAPLMLHLAGPLLTALLGWFPGRRLGMVGDLPGPVMQQWSRWCRHPGFAWGAQPDLVLPSLATARFPVQAFSFSDDAAMTLRCTQQLLAALPNAPSQLHVVAPADVGLKAIGHVGAFRAEAEVLWPRLERAMMG